MVTKQFNHLLKRIENCTHCKADLPFVPKPIIQANLKAKLLIIGQAPSLKVHDSGILWNDASGKRLCQWLGISSALLHDAAQVTIIPMGFCYPGKGKNGDLPPRPECSRLWHQPLLNFFQPTLTLLVGAYAQRYYLREQCKPTLTETVHKWDEYLPRFIPMPHPSPLNNLWLNKNAWFEADVVPKIKKMIRQILKK